MLIFWKAWTAFSCILLISRNTDFVFYSMNSGMHLKQIWLKYSKYIFILKEMFSKYLNVNRNLHLSNPKLWNISIKTGLETKIIELVFQVMNRRLPSTGHQIHCNRQKLPYKVDNIIPIYKTTFV